MVQKWNSTEEILLSLLMDSLSISVTFTMCHKYRNSVDLHISVALQQTSNILLRPKPRGTDFHLDFTFPYIRKLCFLQKDDAAHSSLQ